MTKDQVRQMLGSPARIRDSVKDERGITSDVWEYTLKSKEPTTGHEVAMGVLTSGIGFLDERKKKPQVSFVFVAGQLARWGEEAPKLGGPPKPVPEVVPPKPAPPDTGTAW